MDSDIDRLEEIAQSAEAKSYIYGALFNGHTVEIRPDMGPSFRFRFIREGRLERENLATGHTDPVTMGLLNTHLNNGSGEVEVLESP